MKGLSGKVAMVTGCAGERGVGRAIARRLAADGADLVLTDVAPGGTRVVTTNISTLGSPAAVTPAPPKFRASRSMTQRECKSSA